jgi:uncharacterized membrane protein YccC
MAFAWRPTMPSFTDAAFVAAGVGALLWTLLATDASPRRRTVAGLAGFVFFEVAVAIRYTNIALLIVAVIAVVVLAVATLSYAVWAASFSVAIGLVSSLVLLMLSITTTNTIANAGERLLDVTIGAVIAASAYLLWPSSPQTSVDDALRALRADLARYLDIVMHFEQNATDPAVVAASRRAHLAFSKAESVVAQALDEPSSMRPDGAPLQSTLATSLRLLRVLHALRLLPDPIPTSASDALHTFRSACVAGLLLDSDAEPATMAALAATESASDEFTSVQLLTFDEIANAVLTLNGLHLAEAGSRP